MMATGASYQVVECGHLLPLGLEPCDALEAGEVGYFTASIKTVSDTRVGRMFPLPHSCPPGQR